MVRRGEENYKQRQQTKTKETRFGGFLFECNERCERLLSAAVSTGERNTESLSIERRMLQMKYRKRIYYTEADKALLPLRPES